MPVLLATRRHAPRRRIGARRQRDAFTLIEVALVLAIIILILGLTLPLLERPLAYERLRQAGDQIIAAWTTARIDAMRTGEEQSFAAKDESKYRVSSDPRGGFGAARGHRLRRLLETGRCAGNVLRWRRVGHGADDLVLSRRHLQRRAGASCATSTACKSAWCCGV